jgi:hypothetical protein
MPHCAICSTRIYGPGHYCTLHKPKPRRSHTKEYYNYSSDSTYPGNTHFRTSAGTAGTVAWQRHHHHDPQDSHSALALYNQPYDGPATLEVPALDMPLAYTLAQSFAALQDTHIIHSVTYSVTPAGAQALNVEANLDREQCLICHVWFASREKLNQHRWEYPVGCELHGVCLRSEDVLWHGTDKRHDRCFVKGCGSHFRTEGNWRTGAVERHVRGYHYY